MLTASQGSHVPINFLSKAHPTKLRLIQGDPDTFSDVLTLINEYEGEYLDSSPSPPTAKQQLISMARRPYTT